MNMKTMGGMMALGIGLAGIAPAMAGILEAPEFRRAAATESATPPASESTKPPAVPKPLAPALDESPETAQPAAAEAPLNDTDSKKKKVVPKPVVVEPLTPEQATHKAADPKAPTGALIVKPPEDLPAPAAGSPEPPPASPTK